MNPGAPSVIRWNQRGWGLVETMLTLGALSALSLGIYMVLSPASAAAQAKREQDNLRDLSTAVDRSFGLLGSFEGVSASRVVQDGLAPTRMVEGEALRTAWGTSVTVAPHTVNAPGDGFVVVYPFAPADVCPRLAAAVARDAYDIRVEGVSVYDGGQLNPSATAAACGQADTATMEFVYHSGLVAGTAVAAPPLVLPPVSPSVTPPTSAPMGAPVGPAGPVGPAVPVGPVSTAPVVTPAPMPAILPPPASPIMPTTPSTPGTPSPVTPPTSVAACVVPPSETRSLATCPAGSWGVSNQQRQWWCGDVGGVYEAWATAQPGAWTDTGNTCATCPATFSQTDTQWVAASGTCPTGQVGSITWKYQQTRSRSMSYNCPTGTTALPAATPGAWSSWSNTGATQGVVNTCTPACAAPATTAEAITRAASVETQNVGCPAPQTGEHWQQRSRVENGTRTTSWTCPAPTGSPTSSTVDTWSGTYTATSGWATTSNTCTTPAPVCASSGDPFTLVRYRACTNSSGKTISGASAQKNPATGDYCTAWMPFSGGYGSPHGANYSGSNSMSIEIAWHGATYVCSYGGYIGSSSSGSVSGSGSLPPGMSCGSVNFFPTSQGWGSGGLNILGPGPQYTTCP